MSAFDPKRTLGLLIATRCPVRQCTQLRAREERAASMKMKRRFDLKVVDVLIQQNAVSLLKPEATGHIRQCASVVEEQPMEVVVGAVVKVAIHFQHLTTVSTDTSIFHP